MTTIDAKDLPPELVEAIEEVDKMTVSRDACYAMKGQVISGLIKIGMQFYHLGEIKQAFFKTFEDAGEVWFDSMVNEPEGSWGKFMENLNQEKES